MSRLFQCKDKIFSKIKDLSVYDILKPVFLFSMLLGFTPIVARTNNFEINKWSLLWSYTVSGFFITFAIIHIYYLPYVFVKTATYRIVIHLLQYVSAFYVVVAMITDIKFCCKVTTNIPVDKIRITYAF